MPLLRGLCSGTDVTLSHPVLHRKGKQNGTLSEADLEPVESTLVVGFHSQLIPPMLAPGLAWSNEKLSPLTPTAFLSQP